MGVMDGSIVIEELKKYKLCNWFWSSQIEEQLKRDIVLDYEFVGDMGVYSKYFEFCVPFCGDKKELVGTKAIIHISITANSAKYNLEKAVARIDCFHNVWINVFREEEEILISHFRLWSGQEEEYSGKKSVLDAVFGKI